MVGWSSEACGYRTAAVRVCWGLLIHIWCQCNSDSSLTMEVTTTLTHRVQEDVCTHDGCSAGCYHIHGMIPDTDNMTGKRCMTSHAYRRAGKIFSMQM